MTRAGREGAPRGRGAESGSGILALSLHRVSSGSSPPRCPRAPCCPLFVKSLSGSDTVIGLIAAISPLAGILFSFPVGMLADRWGKKRLLLMAAVVFLVAPLLYLFVIEPLLAHPHPVLPRDCHGHPRPGCLRLHRERLPREQGREARAVLLRDARRPDARPAPGRRAHHWFLFLGGTLSYRACTRRRSCWASRCSCSPSR